MNLSFEDKLVRCLDALESGQSLEQALALYPEDEVELRPVLETARQLSRLPVAHSLEAQVRSRNAFLAQAEAMRAGQARPRPAPGWRRLLFSFGSLAALLLLVVAALFLASASAVPGEPLYGAKRTFEAVQLSLTNDVEARQTLEERFRLERIAEVKILLVEGREAEVAFGAAIEQIDDEKATWLVGGVMVQITADTQIIGLRPQLGYYAWVTGRTLDGELLATYLEVRPPVDALPAPSPSETPPGVTPQAPPQATPASPTTTPTPTQANTPTPSPTSTPEPTQAPSPMPTDDTNGNDNDNDN
ncbi:MAG: DUF5667 domain-containing protein, partial [Chloroflexi bacterium]|nr:DUF5667 domain-containing protein [Chloroflexota bacterium]